MCIHVLNRINVPNLWSAERTLLNFGWVTELAFFCQTRYGEGGRRHIQQHQQRHSKKLKKKTHRLQGFVESR